MWSPIPVWKWFRHNVSENQVLFGLASVIGTSWAALATTKVSSPVPAFFASPRHRNARGDTHGEVRESLRRQVLIRDLCSSPMDVQLLWCAKLRGAFLSRARWGQVVASTSNRDNRAPSSEHIRRDPQQALIGSAVVTANSFLSDQDPLTASYFLKIKQEILDAGTAQFLFQPIMPI